MLTPQQLQFMVSIKDNVLLLKDFLTLIVRESTNTSDEYVEELTKLNLLFGKLIQE